MPPVPNPELVRWVRAYLERGWTVTPLCWPTDSGHCGCGRGHTGRSIGKAPLTDENGRVIKFGPDQVEEAVAYWEKYPANIGIQAEESGLLVADFDEGAPEHWDVWVQSDRGGHVYFRRGDLPPANAAFHYGGQTVQIRGRGYYVVAPPSRHRSGKLYKWTGEITVYEPDEIIREAVLKAAEQSEAAVTGIIPDRLPKVDLDSLNLPGWLHYLILYGQAPEGMRQYPTRSEAEMAAIRGLVRYTDLSDAEIVSIMLDPSYKISEKPRERGNSMVKQLLREIGKARQRVQEELEQERSQPQEEPADGEESDENEDEKWGWVSVPIMELEPEELDWIVEGLIPAGAMVALVGESRAGKSRLVRHLIAALMEGGEFLGFNVVSPFRVLYVIHPNEGTINEVQRDFAKLGVNPYVLAQRAGTGLKFPLQPTGDGFVKALKAHIRRHGYDVVVIDTYGQYMYTEQVEQGDHISWAILNRKLAELAREVKCLINVAHSTRGRSDRPSASAVMLGSENNVGSYQAVLRVVAHKDEATELIRYHTLSVDLRGHAPPPKMYLIYDEQSGRFQKVDPAMVRDDMAERRRRLEEIMRMAARPEGVTRKEVEDALGVAQKTAGDYLRELEQRGVLRREGSGRNVRYFANYPEIVIGSGSQEGEFED